MKNRYNSENQNKLNSQDFTYNKQHISNTYSIYRPKYQLKSPPIIEVYDQEAFEVENYNNSSLSSSISSN